MPGYPLGPPVLFPVSPPRSTIEPATVPTPWREFRAFLARRIRYKVTRGGVLFTFAILLVAFGAVVSANNLLFLIVAAMLATLLVSGLASRLCLAGLALDFQVPEHIDRKSTRLNSSHLVISYAVFCLKK